MKLYTSIIVFVLWFGFFLDGFGQTGTCGQADNFGVINSTSLNCGGDNVIRNVVARSSSWHHTNDLIQVVIDWGDGNPTQTFTLNYVAAVDEWRVAANHVYADNGTQCVYNAFATLRVNGAMCPQSDLSSPFNVTVYDELDNANLGTHEIDHDPTSAGALNTATQEVDVCEGVEDPVRLQDMSDFNCTQPAWNSPPQASDSRNDRDRWIQWVYGTNETITGDVVIGGVTVSAFPYYGPVEHISADTPTPPNEVTLDILMPATAVNGEFLEVTLRSWNICNPYDDNTFDSDPLNPIGGIFDPEVDPNFGPFPNASETPVVNTQIIRIIDTPLPPTAIDNEICHGSDLTDVNFQIVGTAGSTAINWYDGDPTLGGSLIINSNGNNSNTFPAEDHPFGDIASVSGDYSLWASYVMGGTNSCESPAVESVITVRNELTIDDIDYDTGTDPVCAGTPGLQFSLSNAAASETYGGNTIYNWTVSSGLNIVGIASGQSITVDVNSSTSGTKTVSVTRQYTSAPNCISEIKTYTFDVDPTTVAGTLTGAKTICEDESTETLTLSGYTGDIQYWERSFNSGVFSNIGNAGDNTLAQTLIAAGTYDYRVVVESGACTEETSNTIRITVNDKPDAASISGDATICQGDNATLELSVTGGTAPYDIIINNSVGTISWSGTGDNPIVAPTATTTYTITSVIDANGCEPKNADITGSATITIGNPTDATIGGDVSICNGDDADLVVNIAGGNPPYDITITNYGTINGYNSGDPINTGVLFSSTIYTLTSVIDADGCPVLNISDDETTINVGIAISGATLNATDVCAGEDVTFSVDIEDGAPPYILTYEIDGGGAVVETDYSDNEIINLGDLTANTYSINILKVEDQCASDIDNPDAGSVTVNALPTAIDQDIEVCSDVAGGTTATVDLTALESSIDGGTGTTITWYEQNIPLSDPIAGTTSYEVTDGISIYAQVDNGICIDIAEINYNVNPTPMDATNPVDGISCSSDVSGTTISVDDPGAGLSIVWYEDIATTITATGTSAGPGASQFTPANNTNHTYYALVQNITTSCLSLNPVAVQHSVDVIPSSADGGSDAEICETTYVLSATPIDNGGTGFWTSEGVIYFENFENLPDGSDIDNGIFGWNTDLSTLHASYNPPQDYFEVRAGRFESEDLGDGSGTALWRSEIIDVTTLSTIDISLNLFKDGRLEPADFIEAYYLLDGIPTKFGEITRAINDPMPSSAQQLAEILYLDVSGAVNLVLEIRISSDANNEVQGFDDLIIKESGSPSISFDDIFDPTATVSGLEDGDNHIYWNVTSALGACNIPSSEVTITKITAPEGEDLNLTFCEESFSSGQISAVNLNDYNEDVIGTADINDHTVTWYTDAGRTAVVADPTDVSVNDGDTFFALITETVSGSGCTNVFTEPGSITFEINILPQTVDQDDQNNATETVLCETGFNTGVADDVDLTILDADVRNNVGNRIVTWLNSSKTHIPDPTDVDNIHDEDIFYAVVINTLTSCSDTAEVEFTINSRPLENPLRINPGSYSPIVTLCKSNDFVFFQVDDPALNSNTIYEWEIPSNPGEANYIGGGAANFFAILQFPNVHPGMLLRVREKNVITQCYGPWNEVTIIIDESTDKPIIGGPDEVCKNQENVVYTIQNINAGSTYTWNVPSGLGTIISGQGASQITVNIGTANGDITVSEGTTSGCTSPDSDPYPVVVLTSPSMTSPSEVELCSGGLVSDYLNFTADMAATFSWKATSVTGLVSGVTVGDKGTGDISSVLTNSSGATGLGVYEVVPTSGDNCPGSVQVVTISVSPEPVLSSNLDEEVCSGSISGIVLETESNSIAASIYRIENITVPTGLSAGASNSVVGNTGGKNLIANDQFINSTNGDLIVIYEITPIGAGLGCEGQPGTISMTVKAAPVLDDISNTVCNDDVTGIVLQSLPGSVPATDFAITNIIIPSGVVGNAGNATTGSGYADNVIYNDTFINSTNIQKTVVYKIIPSADGCIGTVKDVIVYINPSPQLANLDKVVCSDEGSGIVLSAMASGVSAASYQITDIRIATGLTAASSNAVVGTTTEINYLSSDSFTNSTDAPLTVEYDVIPFSSNSCNGEEKTITLTVEPEVKVNADVATNPICSGELTEITLSSPTIPNSGTITFNYTAVASSGFVSGYIPAMNNLPQGHVIEDALSNNDNVPHTVTYTITPRISGVGTSGCVGNSEAVIITIDPKPSISFNNKKQMICSGEETSIELISSTIPSSGNVTLRLDTIIHDAALSGFSPIGTEFSNGDIVEDALINSGYEVLTATYRFVPFGGNCGGTSIDVNVSVNPEPSVAVSDNYLEVCSGDFVNIALTEPNNVPNTFFRWTVAANDDVNGETSGFGNFIFQTLRNTSNEVQTLEYIITPEVNGCTGIPELVTIDVYPTPNVVLDATFINICEGEPLQILLQGDVSNTQFEWTATSSGNTISGFTNGTGTNGDFIDNIITNSGSSPGTVTYSIKPIGSGVTSCEGISKTFVVSVGPRITGEVLSADIVKCNDNTPAFINLQFNGIPPFTVTLNDGSNDIMLNGVANYHVFQTNPAVTTTYTIKSVIDANGCEALAANQIGKDQDVQVKISNVDVSFSVLNTAGCSPHTVRFEYNQKKDVSYTWSWFDGSNDSTYTATVDEPGKVITHTFKNLSTNAAADIDVRLTAQLPSADGGCIAMHSENIIVHPIIRPNIISEGSTSICSGESISFRNFTQGAIFHKWFYRRTGVNEELEVKTQADFISYTFTNNTTDNRIEYELVYQASNGNCKEEFIIPITVYKGMTAGFNVANLTEYIGGSATLDLNNTSLPLDETNFTYTWAFGSNSTPSMFSGMKPPSVNYSSPGEKTISLTVQNSVAANIGFTCQITYSDIINVIVPPVIADFDIIPIGGCSPLTVEISENRSTGDVFEWEVINSTGKIILSSSEVTPSFILNTPGTYEVVLKTSNAATGQSDIATINNIQVYERPIASFDLRPDVVFMPDPLYTFNQSHGAEKYRWEFGDGSSSVEFEPSHIYTVENIYTVTLVAYNEYPDGVICADSLTQDVTVREGGNTDIPNAFTPNKSGPSGTGRITVEEANDIFLPITEGVEEFNMMVYDRWGNLIFESNDQEIGWDGYDSNGNLLPTGVYVYQLTLLLSNGENRQLLGDVVLIR